MGAKYSYEQAREFIQIIGQKVNDKIPDITSLERSPEKRKDKVYLDAFQNGEGQTIAAPYCLRAKPGATVSTPLEWDEVKAGLKPSDFTIKNALARFKKKGDIYKDVLGAGIDMAKALENLDHMS